MTARPCPYSASPPSALWSQAVAGVPRAEVSPHAHQDRFITPESRVASAGSCFAQRISAELRRWNYSYMVVEDGPPWLSEAERFAQNYGVFTARYGNLYTTLQLLQLFERAYGRFTPREGLWRSKSGGWVDPFRPRVQPGGFDSEAECLRDRDEHLDAVRRMFETMDVFVFTLGLTEGWRSLDDGAMLPVCPGCGAGGSFDDARYGSVNFSVAEVVAHLEAFLAGLAAVNPAARVILTVSPTPLLATFEDRHVLAATVYSKSVLRVACEEVVRRHAQTRYFASYEIVTATGNADYFLEDRRSVSPAAVAHVMRCFQDTFCTEARAAAAQPGTAEDDEAVCDETAVVEALADDAARRC